MKREVFDEVIAYDFSSLNFSQSSSEMILMSDSCNCDHCDYESGGSYDSSGGCNAS